MRVRTRILFALSLPLIILSNDGLRSPLTSQAEPNYARQVGFQVSLIETRGGERIVISEALIQGPTGTDFNIDLRAGHLKLNAGFLTDLATDHSLKVNVNLSTRRLYGYSERDLPLYEEDIQRHTILVESDESIILLPFGDKDASEKLSVEISPSIILQKDYSPAEQVNAPEIRILKVAPDNIFNVQAFKRPHNFTVEATLLEDGQEVAHGATRYLLQEQQEIELQPNGRRGSNIMASPLLLNLTINGFTQGPPADQVSISFDLYRIDRSHQDGREAIALNWAGAGTVGSELSYDLSDLYLPTTGRQYSLKLKIRL